MGSIVGDPVTLWLKTFLSPILLLENFWVTSSEGQATLIELKVWVQPDSAKYPLPVISNP